MKKMAWLAVLPLLLSAAESPGRTPEPNRTPEALPLYPKGAPESNGLAGRLRRIGRQHQVVGVDRPENHVG